MSRQWDAEKALLERVHRLKEELERVKIEAAAAVRPAVRTLVCCVMCLCWDVPLCHAAEPEGMSSVPRLQRV